jgi:glucoamylase
MKTASTVAIKIKDERSSTRDEQQTDESKKLAHGQERALKPKPSSAAFGQPGIEPKWTHGNKDGVGTAYADSSRIWFTLWNGAVTEVYHPTVDRPQLRDLQYLITDGKSFLHEEKRNLKSKLERLSNHTLGYRCINSDPDGRYAIVKEIITAPHLNCVLQRTKLTGEESFLSTLRLYVLCAPHLEVGVGETTVIFLN